MPIVEWSRPFPQLFAGHACRAGSVCSQQAQWSLTTSFVSTLLGNVLAHTTPLFLFSLLDLCISLLKIEAFKQDLCGHLKQISSGTLCVKAGRGPRTDFETRSLNHAAI